MDIYNISLQIKKDFDLDEVTVYCKGLFSAWE